MTRESQSHQLDQASQIEPEPATKVIPAAGVIIFDGDSVLAFEHAKDTTVGKGIWGFPGGRHEVDIKTGRMETNQQAASREVKQETDVNVKAEDLIDFGAKFRKVFGKNGTSELVEWTVLYTDKWSGKPAHVQPEEGRPEIMHFLDFLALPDDIVAPNAKLALINAVIHYANN